MDNITKPTTSYSLLRLLLPHDLGLLSWFK